MGGFPPPRRRRTGAGRRPAGRGRKPGVLRHGLFRKSKMRKLHSSGVGGLHGRVPRPAHPRRQFGDGKSECRQKSRAAKHTCRARRKKTGMPHFVCKNRQGRGAGENSRYGQTTKKKESKGRIRRIGVPQCHRWLLWGRSWLVLETARMVATRESRIMTARSSQSAQACGGPERRTRTWWQTQSPGRTTGAMSPRRSGSLTPRPAVQKTAGRVRKTQAEKQARHNSWAIHTLPRADTRHLAHT